MCFDLNKYLPLNDTVSIDLLIKKGFKGKRIPDSIKNTIYAALENDDLKTHFRKQCADHNRQIAENEKQKRLNSELDKVKAAITRKPKKDIQPKTFECRASSLTFTDGCIILRLKSRELRLKSKRVVEVPQYIVSSLKETFKVRIEPENQFKFVPAEQLSKILKLIDEKQNTKSRSSGYPILQRQIEDLKHRIEKDVRKFLEVKITQFWEYKGIEWDFHHFDIGFSSDYFGDLKSIFIGDTPISKSLVCKKWKLDDIKKTATDYFLEHDKEYTSLYDFLEQQLKICENHIESLRNDWINYYCSKAKKGIEKYIFDNFNICVDKEFCKVDGTKIIIPCDKLKVSNNDVRWEELKSLIKGASEFNIDVSECVESLKRQLTERINEVTSHVTTQKFAIYESALSPSNLSLLFGLTDAIRLKFDCDTLKLDCTAFTSKYIRSGTFLLGDRILERKHIKESDLLYFSERYSKYILGEFYKFDSHIEDLWIKFIDGYLNPAFKEAYSHQYFGRTEFEKYIYKLFDPILKVSQYNIINNNQAPGRYIDIDFKSFKDIYVINEDFDHFSDHDPDRNWPGKSHYLSYLLVKDGVLHVISKDYDSAYHYINIPKNWEKFVLYATMRYFTSRVCNKRQQFKLFKETLYSFMRDNDYQVLDH